MNFRNPSSLSSLALASALAVLATGCASVRNAVTPASEAPAASAPAAAPAPPPPPVVESISYADLSKAVQDSRGSSDKLADAVAGKEVSVKLRQVRKSPPQYAVNNKDRQVFTCGTGTPGSKEITAVISGAEFPAKSRTAVIALERCDDAPVAAKPAAAPSAAAAPAAAAAAAAPAASTGGAAKPGMDARGYVVDSSQVESGSGRKVKGINDYEGEITGIPAANSKFTKLQIGMSWKQVIDTIGEPTDSGAYVTGKAWIPFYFGGDRHRLEMTYKGQGRLIFAGGSGFSGIGSGNLIWIIHSANESGYR